MSYTDKTVFVSGVGYNFDHETAVYPKRMSTTCTHVSHTDFVVVNNMEYIMQVTFAFTLIYVWTLACLKLSQLVFYWRAFSIQLRYWIYAGVAIVICWALIFS